jgi:hypothetical protein
VNAGDWIATASAIVAAAGALIAWRQARLAKRSAEAADRQATAAEEQVAIMQKQLENETTDRHEAAAPRFIVQSAVLSTFAVLRFRDQRWVGSCLTSRAGLTLTVAQRAMP